MRVRDVAKLLGVAPVTIRRLEATGEIKTPQRDRNDHRRYTDADVDAIRRVLYGQPAPKAPPGANASPRSDRVSRLVNRLKEGREQAKHTPKKRGR